LVQAVFKSINRFFLETCVCGNGMAAGYACTYSMKQQVNQSAAISGWMMIPDLFFKIKTNL
jgi:hypothetical protein